MSESITVELGRVYEYQSNEDGQVKGGNSVTCFSPSGEFNLICAKLDQGFYRAQIDGTELAKRLNPEAFAAKTNQTESEIDMPDEPAKTFEADPDTVQMVLLSSKSVDFAEYLETFKGLILKKGICFLDEKTVLTQTLWNKFDYKDQRKILAEYLAGFLLN